MPLKRKHSAPKEFEMHKPKEFFHTHQSTGPSWHYEPTIHNPFERNRGRVITRRGSPKMYFASMTAMLLIAAYVLSRVVFDII